MCGCFQETSCAFDFKLSPCSEWYILSGGSPASEFYVSKFPNIPFYIHRRCKHSSCFTSPMKMKQSVPKRRNIKFRRRETTQKKEYNIQWCCPTLPCLLLGHDTILIDVMSLLSTCFTSDGFGYRNAAVLEVLWSRSKIPSYTLVSVVKVKGEAFSVCYMNACMGMEV
jgi:hypothetical protein